MSRLLGYPAGIPGLVLPALQIVSEFNKTGARVPAGFRVLAVPGSSGEFCLYNISSKPF